MKLSRGVLGLPLLMLAFAITITKRAERRPISLLRKAQLLERGGDLQEAARAYDSLVSQYPGTPAGCRAVWESFLVPVLHKYDDVKRVLG